MKKETLKHTLEYIQERSHTCATLKDVANHLKLLDILRTILRDIIILDPTFVKYVLLVLQELAL